MKKAQETPEQTLVRLSRSVGDVSADFERTQGALRIQLRKEMLQAKTHMEEQPQEAPYRSGWLPGPLSYPWLLMFASVPKVIEHLLRQG